MDRLLDRLIRGLQIGAAEAADKAEELSRLGRARLDIAAVQTRIRRHYIRLGQATFEALEADRVADLTQDPDVAQTCAALARLNEELAIRQAALDDLRRAFQRAPAAPPADPLTGPPTEPPIGPPA